MGAIGINDFLKKQFNTFQFTDEWKASFGEPEKNFKAIVYGHSGNGKTEFCIKWAKYLAQFAKVYYNSFEQGISKTLQDALKRNNMGEVAGRVIFGDKETFAQMLDRLKSKNGPQIVLIDSRDYMNLTTEQFKKLIEAFPRKAFIIICWESGGKPKGEYGKSIEFQCDIKIRVSNFKAYPKSRFGGNDPFVIWDRKPKVGEQLQLMKTG
jgi:hypothetical protein